MVINNVNKDRSLQRCLVLDILTNPDRELFTKKVTFWGKIQCQFRCLHEVSLASECTRWYTVFNEGAGFASHGVAFLYGRYAWSRSLWLANRVPSEAGRQGNWRARLGLEPWFFPMASTIFFVAPFHLGSLWATCCDHKILLQTETRFSQNFLHHTQSDLSLLRVVPTCDCN